MTPSTCDDIIELIPAFVLGALDAHDATRVAAHVAACPRCRAEAESFRDTVGLLPYAAGAIDPPPHVKRQLFARIAATNDTPSTPAVQPQRPVTVRAPSPGRWFAPALAIMLTLILGLGAATFQLATELATNRQTLSAAEAQIVQLRQTAQTVEAQLITAQRELDETRVQLAASQRELREIQASGGKDEQLVSFIAAPQTVSQLLGTTERAPDEASARMFMQPGHNRLVLLIYGLKSAEPGKVYRLWLAKGSQAIAIGTVTVGPDGVAEFVVDAPEPMDAYDQVMITLDEIDTAAQPSEEIIFEANL